MINPVVNSIDIVLESDTIKAGEAIPGWANVDLVLDPNNPLTIEDGWFRWWVEDVTPGIHANERNIIGGPEGRRLTLTDMAGQPIVPGTPVKADSILIGAEKAYTYITIRGEFELDGGRKDTTITVFVKPGDPHAVFIEPSSDSSRVLPARPAGPGGVPAARPAGLSALRNSDPVDTIRILVAQPSHDQFFAVLRDRFGNWVQPAAAFPSPRNPPYNVRAITWNLAQITGQPVPGTMVTVPANLAAMVDVARGQGRVNRVQNSPPGAARLEFTCNINSGNVVGNYSTFTTVVVEGFSVIAIRMGVSVPGSGVRWLATSPGTPAGHRIPSADGVINMVVGENATVQAQVMRSDNIGNWVDADGQWGDNAAALFVSRVTGISQTSSFSVGSTSPPEGLVRVNIPGNTAEFAEVRVVVTLGPPVSMRLYGAGQTLAAAPNASFIHPLPPAAVRVRAGQPLPIVPKLFADNTTNANMWVQPTHASYNRDNFSWRFTSEINDSTRISAAGAGNVNQTAISGRDSISFRSTVAFQTYIVEGTYRYTLSNPTRDTTLSRLLHIEVVPDYTDPRLVIEADDRPPQQLPSLHARKLDELVFDSEEVANETPKSIYAILRDQWGNFIGFAGGINPYTNQPTTYPTWDMFTPGATIRSVTPGNTSLGEGIVIANSSGESQLRANGGAASQLRDQITVRVLAYTYRGLAIAVRVTQAEYNDLPADQRMVTHNDVAQVNGWYRVYTGTNVLEINSNQDTTFYVLGQIYTGNASNPRENLWEPVTANWSSPLSHILGNAPSNAGSWSISPSGPSGPGASAIVASRPGQVPARDNDGNIIPGQFVNGTLTANLNIRVLVGPPTGVTLEILNANNLVAGTPIQGVIRYTNRAGVITHWEDAWGSKDAWFGGTLGRGEPRPEPLVGVNVLGYLGITPNNGIYGNILPEGSNATLNLSEVRAQDTVTFTMYLAAEHQIRIYHPNPLFGAGTSTPGYVTALSDRFTVRAGSVDRVEITETNPCSYADSAANRCPPAITGRTYIYGTPDTIVYNYREGAQDLLTSVGFDQWGNVTGPQTANWGAENVINTIPNPNINGVPQVIYNSRDAQEIGEGWITIVAVGPDGQPLTGSDGQPITAQIYVRIVEVTVAVSSARTLDVDANGLIDRIELTFPKAVSVQNEALRGEIRVCRDANTCVTVESIRTPDGRSDAASNVWHLILNELVTPDMQTGWDFDVVVPAGVFSEVERISTRTIDGAAPVISSARKFFAQREGDPNRLEVTFSERVFRGLLANRTPDDVFNVWMSDTTGSLTRRSQRMAKAAAAGTSCDGRIIVNNVQGNGLLSGIPAMNTGTGDATLTIEFDLGRGSESIDLNTRHFINIKVEGDASYIRDTAGANGNVQRVYCNRLVPVTFANDPPAVARAIPNPSSPDPNRPGIGPGVLRPVHDPGAADHVRQGGGGSIVRVPLRIPGTTQGKVGCQVKVYDLVGNLVHSARTDDLVRDSGPDVQRVQGNPEAERIMNVDLYWNGYNSRGMKVAPGTYRLIVQFNYSDPDLRNQFRGRNKFTAPVGISK